MTSIDFVIVRIRACVRACVHACVCACYRIGQSLDPATDSTIAWQCSAVWIAVAVLSPVWVLPRLRTNDPRPKAATTPHAAKFDFELFSQTAKYDSLDIRRILLGIHRHLGCGCGGGEQLKTFDWPWFIPNWSWVLSHVASWHHTSSGTSTHSCGSPGRMPFRYLRYC